MIQFESPLWFLALVPLVPFLALCARQSYADLPASRNRLALALRLLGVLFVTLALARPVLLLENTDRVVLYLIDVSESVPAASLEESWDELQAFNEARADGEQAGVVLFARRPRLVVPPTAEPIELTPELERRLFHEREH